MKKVMKYKSDSNKDCNNNDSSKITNTVKTMIYQIVMGIVI